MQDPQGSPDPERYVKEISKRGLSIYDPIDVGDPDLWIPSSDLQHILGTKLQGKSLAGLALRTRSKVLKSLICEALGYPEPRSFKKTKPRFPGQCFDTYAQKSNNLQVWNEELHSARRYVVVRVSGEHKIAGVRVVNGDELAKLDKTGTLTQKYQARMTVRTALTELVTAVDTTNVADLVAQAMHEPRLTESPIAYPRKFELLSISSIHARLSQLVGATFLDEGADQERNRGAALHRLVCESLGYARYQDNGSFPDIRHQLLEVKLQTSPTVDLGLVSPDSTAVLDLPQIDGRQLRHCDVRYAVFAAQTDGKAVTISNVYLSTGEGFFYRFPKFQGKVLNKKLQIPLPASFFGG